MTAFTVLEVRRGRAVPYGPNGEPSAIDKQPVNAPVLATANGLEGDEQGDRRHHGGPDKALHAYPLAHYAAWAEALPEAKPLFRPGAFGENLVVDGVTERACCLGDRFQIGEAVVELSQSRQPCWRLNLRFNLPDMARRVQASGLTGWYFRVLEPGLVAAGDRARLLARPHADWPLARVATLLYRTPLESEALADFLALPGLPASWRRMTERRLASRRVEDWRSRLDTPQ